MNILVLGGNGYLGSKVSHELVQRGHLIICTKRIGSDLSRLNDIKDSIQVIPSSIDTVRSVFRDIPIDYVLNMVCNYGRGDTLYRHIIEANLEFPLRVLDQAAESGTQNYLTIGTGLPSEMNMYSFSKKQFSVFGKFYTDKQNMNFNSLQLEMFYGEDEPSDRFIPSIIHKMVCGDEVDTTLGFQHRDIICIQDVVKAVLMVMESGLKGYHEIPVGTGEAPAISEIIDFIWMETGQKSKVNKGAIPMRDNEPDCVADTSILKSIGEWKPIFWKEGLKNMLNLIREGGVILLYIKEQRLPTRRNAE